MHELRGSSLIKLSNSIVHKQILEKLSKRHKILVAKIEGEFLTNFSKTQNQNQNKL